MEELQEKEQILDEIDAKVSQIIAENDAFVEAAVEALCCDDAKKAAAALKRLRQRREWDSKNMLTISTRLPREEGKRFHRLCRRLGTTRYKVLAGYIRAFLEHHGA